MQIRTSSHSLSTNGQAAKIGRLALVGVFLAIGLTVLAKLLIGTQAKFKSND